MAALGRYRTPDLVRSIVELAITIVPLVLLWLLMWFALELSYGLCLLLSVPTAGFLVRLFMIQHDCGHGAFFRRRALNDWLGRVIGVLTLTPYDYWRHTHALHHANSGNLSRRGFGDVDTLTVREYLALSPLGRWRYRAYRHPAVLFGVAPAFLFLLQQRLPIGLMRAGWRPWLSTMATNLAIAALATLVISAVGLGPFLLVHLPVTLLGATVGVWLFYVQHQFEDTYWQAHAAWRYDHAALEGSSYLKLPGLLRFFTGNIGFHHVHHLSVGIPNYNLQAAHNGTDRLQTVPELTLHQGLRATRLKLWDEQRGQLVTFREARA